MFEKPSCIVVKSPRVVHFNGVSAVYATDTSTQSKVKIAHASNDQPLDMSTVPKDCRGIPDRITAISTKLFRPGTHLTVVNGNTSALSKYCIEEDPKLVRELLEKIGINEHKTPDRNCAGTLTPLPQIKRSLL